MASAVAEHVFISGHQMDLSKARVVDAHPNTQTCCLLESWHIQMSRPHSKGGGAQCQDSMLLCWTDIILSA